MPVTTMMDGWPTSVPVLIPVYNHERTVGQVVAGCRAEGAALIVVVDDGSTDGSGALAAAAGADLVLTVAPNRGKGHALATGLRHLSAAGHRRALSIDADMQHPPGEARRLAWVSELAPMALWLGERDMAGAPAASRFGRWWTSLWTWVACGVWPGDNQTGLRVYPLPAMVTIRVRAGRYAYEVESLVRAVWGGVAVRRLPVAVRYPADRVSHFDKTKDNLRTAWAFTRLVTRRCLPWPHAPAEGGSPWAAALRSGLSPGAAARAAALGAAMGVAPIPGLQMAAAAWLALALRLNPAVALVASNLSFGPLLAAWFALEVAVGHALRHGTMLDLGATMSSLRGAITANGPWAALRPLLADWLLGAGPVMAAAALGAGAIAWVLARAVQRGRG